MLPVKGVTGVGTPTPPFLYSYMKNYIYTITYIILISIVIIILKRLQSHNVTLIGSTRQVTWWLRRAYKSKSADHKNHSSFSFFGNFKILGVTAFLSLSPAK